MSRSPESTRTGTFGIGPGPRFVPPDGAGQSTQLHAGKIWNAQGPNAPDDPGGSPAIEAFIAAVRASVVSVGCHGNGPSPQLVASSRMKLMSLVELVLSASRKSRRSSGRMLPAAAASTA